MATREASDVKSARPFPCEDIEYSRGIQRYVG